MPTAVLVADRRSFDIRELFDKPTTRVRSVVSLICRNARTRGYRAFKVDPERRHRQNTGGNRLKVQRL